MIKCPSCNTSSNITQTKSGQRGTHPLIHDPAMGATPNEFRCLRCNVDFVECVFCRGTGDGEYPYTAVDIMDYIPCLNCSAQGYYLK